MAKKIVTLYIDDNSLRLVVTRGERIKEWAYLPLDRGMVAHNVVADESGLAAKIKQLLKIQKIGRKKVMVGLSGLHCLSRPITLPQLPKEMLDEAIRREARRVLPVPLEQLYISWQAIPAPEGQAQVLLVALPCATVDALVDALRQAGLEAGFISIKPLLLASATKEATAIIIDVQPTEFDIVIMVKGIPQTIRTAPFPDEVLPLADKMKIIASELDRAFSFYKTYASAESLTPDVPVITSGELAHDMKFYQVLSDDFGHPVLPLTSPFESPDGFNPNLYLANIGLARHQWHRGTNGAPLVTLNSLPLIYQTKSVSLANVLVLPGAVVAMLLLAFLVMMNQNAAADINSMRTQVAKAEQVLQQALSQKQSLAGDIEALKNKVKEAETSHNNFQAALDTMKVAGLRINGNLTATIQNLPGAITLSGISHSGDALAITGLAQGKNDILSYLMKLQSSNLFGEIAISGMAKAKDGGMDFTLSLDLEKPGNMAAGTEVVLRYLPLDVSLQSISQANDKMTINGRAPDEDSIVLFLRKLEESSAFREINLSGKTSVQEGGIDFTITVEMRE